MNKILKIKLKNKNISCNFFFNQNKEIKIIACDETLVKCSQQAGVALVWTSARSSM